MKCDRPFARLFSQHPLLNKIPHNGCCVLSIMVLLGVGVGTGIAMDLYGDANHALAGASMGGAAAIACYLAIMIPYMLMVQGCRLIDKEYLPIASPKPNLGG